MVLYLAAIAGDNRGGCWLVDQQGLTLGHDADCDIALKDPTVSGGIAACTQRRITSRFSLDSAVAHNKTRINTSGHGRWIKRLRKIQNRTTFSPKG
jgi:hypothetical protein